MTAILLADADSGRTLALGDRLTQEGYEVEAAADGGDALARALSGCFDLAILDVVLPGRDGLDVCLELRKGGFDGPVIFVTDCAKAADCVVGLRLGADDFLTRPFEMAELVARVESCLRRGERCAPARPTCRFGTIEVDLRGARVLRAGRAVAMSAREYQLLRCLVEHAGIPLSRDQLLDGAWGRNAMPTPRTVDVHVAWLRRKLEADPRRPTLIRTVHGVGYIFAGGAA